MDEATQMNGGSSAYKTGVGMIILTSFLIVWTTIVRDNGAAAGQFMIILAVGVGGFATRGRADGMARTLFGVAVMQALLGMLTATAPITAAEPDGVMKAIIYNGAATAFWLISAWCFQIASNRSR